MGPADTNNDTEICFLADIFTNICSFGYFYRYQYWYICYYISATTTNIITLVIFGWYIGQYLKFSLVWLGLWLTDQYCHTTSEYLFDYTVRLAYLHKVGAKFCRETRGIKPGISTQRYSTSLILCLLKDYTGSEYYVIKLLPLLN